MCITCRLNLTHQALYTPKAGPCCWFMKPHGKVWWSWFVQDSQVLAEFELAVKVSGLKGQMLRKSFMYRLSQKPLSAYSSDCSHSFTVKCVDPHLAWWKGLASGTAAPVQVRWPSQLDWFLSSKICFQSLARRRWVCSQNVFHIVASVWFHLNGGRLQNIYRTLFITARTSRCVPSEQTRRLQSRV